MKTTRQESRERLEKILAEVAQPGEFREMWQERPKGAIFTIIAYFVRGEIVLVQLFDNGSIYPFLSVNTIRWDLTEQLIADHCGKVTEPKS